MNDDAAMLAGVLACFLLPAAFLLALIAFGAFDDLPGMAVFLIVCAFGIAVAVMFTKYITYMANRESGHVDSPRRRLGNGSRNHFGDGWRGRACRRCR